MVHRLRRRNGEEPVAYPSAELEEVFRRTWASPLFRTGHGTGDHVAADYTPEQADELRRSMALEASWRPGTPPRAATRACSPTATDRLRSARIFEQIKASATTRFPMNPAPASPCSPTPVGWKRHEPAAFACLLISQTSLRRLHSPDQLLQDARRHALRNARWMSATAGWDYSLEPFGQAQPAIRLGLRMIEAFARMPGVSSRSGRSAVPRRARSRPAAGSSARALELLAGAGASAVSPDTGTRRAGPSPASSRNCRCSAGDVIEENAVSLLPAPSRGEELLSDHALLFHLGPHPLKLLRGQLKARRCRDSRRAQWRNWDMGDRYGSPAWSIVAAPTDRQRHHLHHPGRRVRHGQRGVRPCRSGEGGHSSSPGCRWRASWSPPARCATSSPGACASLSPLLTGLDVRSRDFRETRKRQLERRAALGWPTGMATKR